VTSLKLCVFIIAICNEPWAFSEHQVSLFQKRISLPFPTIQQKSRLLDHFLDKVQNEHKLKKKHTINGPDLERIASFPSLRRFLIFCFLKLKLKNLLILGLDGWSWRLVLKKRSSLPVAFSGIKMLPALQGNYKRSWRFLM
jgi:hypothetical protein